MENIKSGGKLERVGDEFIGRIEYIKNKRLDNGADKIKKSTRALTNLIIKHEAWGRIENDTIEFEGVIK